MSKILMLHRVLPEYDPDNYYFQRNTAISWKCFTNLLNQIEADGIQTLPISVWKRQANTRSVFITFDDGYADNAQALDEILERGMTATLFPVKQFIQEGFSPIDDMAFQLMKQQEIPEKLYQSLLSGQLKKMMRRMSFKRYRYLRKKWFSLVKDVMPKELFLTEKQLTGFSSRGIELGIHGSSHRIFTALSDKDLQQELESSADWLYGLDAHGTLPICFPHGAHDQRVISACSSFGNIFLGVDTAPSCPSVLRRIHIKEEH